MKSIRYIYKSSYTAAVTAFSSKFTTYLNIIKSISEMWQMQQRLQRVQVTGLYN